MTKATIQLDGAAGALLGDALLDMLGGEAQRLDQALARRDRGSHRRRTRAACRRIRRLARLLDVVGWGDAAARGGVRIDPHDQLPIAIAALRRALIYAEDNAKDACARGDGEQAVRATMRLHETWEALLGLEVQAARLSTRR